MAGYLSPENAQNIAPWITVRNCLEAIKFYTDSFGASVQYRLDGPAGPVVARLTIHHSEFWIGEDENNFSLDEMTKGGQIRIILTVPDPQETFKRAIENGASPIYPVSESHGWVVGRLKDPFGLHWEIGHPIEI
ncbi:MAG TPA: VOC family protein [Puia sp.]|nr:VOC family protein [Puia sp.]